MDINMGGTLGGLIPFMSDVNYRLGLVKKQHPHLYFLTTTILIALLLWCHTVCRIDGIAFLIPSPDAK